MRAKIQDLIVHHASGPSPTCEERNIGDDQEWGLLKTTAVTWGGWNSTAHKVPPQTYWCNRSIEVRAGDVLITKAGPRNRCGVTVYISETQPRLMVSGKMILLRPDTAKTNAPYLASVLASTEIQRYLDARTTGLADAQLNFTNQLLLGTEIDLPNPEMQARIADIRTTLDETIEQTEALIAKTQQIKVGLLHDLFTRGVTPDGQLRLPREEAPQLYKESSLGWIPKEWKAGGIEDYLVQIGGLKPGPFGSSLTKANYVSSGFRVYGQEQVLARSLEKGNYYIPMSKWLELNAFSVAKGDLLMTLVGVGTVGKVIVVDTPFEPGVINPRLMRIRPDGSKCCTAFLAHMIPSPLVRRQFNQYATGGTMPVLNSSIVRKVKVPVVPFVEQLMIADQIDCCKVALDLERKAFRKLEQQKQGLMHDLLTGCVLAPVSDSVKEAC